MILGAGPFQAPAIRKATAMGCHVITVDYLPDNVGHPYGHQYVNLSTVDKEEVLKAALDLRIDGICTFSSDVAIPTVAHVCDAMGLRGASSAVAGIMATKHRFRTFLRDAGLTCPDFFSADTVEAVNQELQRMSLPLVVKPVDTSGSRGITRLDRLDVDSVSAAFLKAQSYSRSKTVCFEQFIEGTEVGGDAILVNGRVAFVAITHKHLSGFVVTGHNLPTNISARDQEHVLEHIEAICAALDYRNGPLNFDAMVSANGVTMLEMSARNGGNGIPAVIARATGVDLEEAAICLALGMTPDLPDHCEVKSGAGSFVFGDPTGGRLQRMCTAEDIKRLIPEVFHVYFNKQVGDHVEPFEHNGNFIGFALFDCADAADYESLTEKITDALKLEFSDS